MNTNFLLPGAILIVMASCGNNKTETGTGRVSNNETGYNMTGDEDFAISDKKWTSGSGTFTLGRDSYAGKTFTQQVRSLANIGCEQQSDPLTTLTVSLASFDEKGNLKLSANILETGSGEVFVTINGGHSIVEYFTTEASTGSVVIAGNTITIKELKLFNASQQEKILNATLNF